MPLGWKVRQGGEPVKLEGGKCEFGVRHSTLCIYETLDVLNISVPFEHHHTVRCVYTRTQI